MSGQVHVLLRFLRRRGLVQPGREVRVHASRRPRAGASPDGPGLVVPTDVGTNHAVDILQARVPVFSASDLLLFSFFFARRVGKEI